MTTIEDVFDLIRNGVSIKQHPEKSGFPITRIETISNRVVDRTRMGYAGITDISKYKDYILQDEDILMSHINSIQHLGKAAIYKKIGNEKIIHGMNLLCLRPKKDKIHSSFALYYFLSDDFHRKIASITKPSVNQASFTISALKKLSFPSFSISEQQKIASKFDAIGQIIVLREQQLSKLDQLVKSRFVEMFGDPASNPYGWELATVEDVCSSIVRGPFGSALKKEFFVKPDKTTYKVYEQKNAIRKSATIGTYYINKEKYYELRRFECFPGDILMSCSGTMGELYQLPPTSEKGIINQALCKFTLNNKILPVFFLAYMKETIGNLEVKGSGIQNIAAVSYVKAMPINLPPISVQKQFATFCTQVDKSKLPVKQSLEKLETLKKSLMQEYFG